METTSNSFGSNRDCFSVRRRDRRQAPLWVLPVTFLVVGFISQATIAKSSLPLQNRFNYPAVQPISFLQKTNQRMVAIGDHLCRPNTAAVYGISDIRSHNPLFPDGCLGFLKLAGAKVDAFNQVFNLSSNTSNKFLDSYECSLCAEFRCNYEFL